MGKTVQNLFPFTDPLHGKTIILLIQEKSGLLSVHNVYHIMDAILHNLHIRVKLCSDKSLYLRQAFLRALVRIASLVNATNADPVLRKCLL